MKFSKLVLLLFSVSMLQAAPVKVSEKPPKEGTPEKVAVDFVNLIRAGKKEEVFKLLTKDLQEFYTKYKGFLYKSTEKSYKKLDLAKTFEYNIGAIKDGVVTIDILSKTKGKTSGTSRRLRLKKVDKKWLIKKK